MICRACEDAIADALLHTRGVVSAQAHYWRGRVTITYDPNIVTEDTLRQVLTNAGYPPGTHGMGGVVVDGICLALVGVLYWGLPKLLALVKVPALANNASRGLVFLVGLLTSTHCIGMCGGILLAQTTDARGVTGRSKRGRIAAAAYNGGRVVSYTAVGALCTNREALTLADPRVTEYLSGREIAADTAADGWCCVTVDGWPLGGGKVSGGRVKNHYPKALRLL